MLGAMTFASTGRVTSTTYLIEQGLVELSAGTRRRLGGKGRSHSQGGKESNDLHGVELITYSRAEYGKWQFATSGLATDASKVAWYGVKPVGSGRVAIQASKSSCECTV